MFLCFESVSGISDKQMASHRPYGIVQCASSNQIVQQIVAHKKSTYGPPMNMPSLHGVPSDVAVNAIFWQRIDPDIDRIETVVDAISDVFQRATSLQIPGHIQHVGIDTLAWVAQTASDVLQRDGVAAQSAIRRS